MFCDLKEPLPRHVGHGTDTMFLRIFKDKGLPDMRLAENLRAGYHTAVNDTPPPPYTATEKHRRR